MHGRRISDRLDAGQIATAALERRVDRLEAGVARELALVREHLAAVRFAPRTAPRLPTYRE